MGYLLIFLYIMAVLYVLSKKNIKAFKFLMFICFFQNIGLVITSRFLNGTQYIILTLLKEIYVVLFLGKLLIHKRKISKDVAFCLVAILILVGLMLVHGQGKLMGQLLSLRQLYLPFLFYALGRLAEFTQKDLKEASIYYIRLCIMAVAFGIIEYILDERLWIPLGIEQYMNLKGVGRFLRPDGMPRAFYSFDLGLGYAVRRMASILADAVIMGQLLAFGFIISAFSRNLYSSKIAKWFCTVILAIGCLLSMGKGGIVIAVVSFCILLRDVYRKKVSSWLLLLIVCIVCVIYFGFGIRNELSVSNHYDGLISGIAVLKSNPLGIGIGSSGNLAQSYGTDSTERLSGSESYVGSMLAQTGVIGLLLNLIIVIYIVSNSDYGNESAAWLIKSVKVLTMVLYVTSFVNYTAISFTSCFIYFIYSGATKSKNFGIEAVSV